MSLCPKLQVKLPEKGVIVAKSGKYPYVYHVDATYRNERGIPTNKKRSIGKLDNESGMLIPNKTYYEIYEDQREEVVKSNVNETIISYGTVCTIGIIAVVKAVFEQLGIASILTSIIGEERYQKGVTIIPWLTN